ncbi:MAG: HNH endonuclease [Muribaculaceae bacterium]|nr:HNH endonuclease [Muribaculaceae bacterium]
MSPPSERVLNEYYTNYAPIIQSKIVDFLEHGRTIPVRLGSKHIITCTVGINPDSTSFVYEFLNDLLDDRNLKNLLLGDINVLMGIVRKVYLLPDIYLGNLTKKRLSSMKYQEGDILEDFYTIVKEIFVSDIYENTGVFNKTQFIEDRGLRICPYCGISNIEVTKRTDKRVIKPHIDHFLPKSIYPFLALSFYNLIPACPECNMEPNKGDRDPLSSDKRLLHLMNPYSFDEGSFIFTYSYNGAGDLDSTNFKVGIDYLNNIHLEKGYNEITAVEPIYKKMNKELHALWTQMRNLNNSRLKFAKVLLPNAEIDDLISNTSVLGYVFEERNSRIYAYYKFNKDLYTLIRKDFTQND